jgi:hypothetical protein
MSEFKIPFAYHNGQCIDVSTAQKGVTYQCTCGADVKLRGGEKVRNHFYHVNNETCSYESIIHKAYKEVFSRIKKIRLPYAVNGQTYWQFDRVELEKKLHDFIPDAIGYIGDDMYIIEFAKTSFIGKRKLTKIKAANVMCIEIQIINCESLNFISEHLLANNHREIIHIPQYEEMRIMREKFANAYREAIQEQKIWSGVEWVTLNYKGKSKNNRDMYLINNSTSGKVVAFVNHGSKMDLRLECTPWYYSY